MLENGITRAIIVVPEGLFSSLCSELLAEVSADLGWRTFGRGRTSAPSQRVGIEP